jgi:uncharacterized protein YdcH (DUF465 family)
MIDENTRQYQFQSRFGINGSNSMPRYAEAANSTTQERYPQRRTQGGQRGPSAKRISQHQEFFIQELQVEIQELRAKMRDFGSLKAKYRQVQEAVKRTQIESQRLENESLDRIAADRVEIDRLIRELDILRAENDETECEQV